MFGEYQFGQPHFGQSGIEAGIPPPPPVPEAPAGYWRPGGRPERRLETFEGGALAEIALRARGAGQARHQGAAGWAGIGIRVWGAGWRVMESRDD